MLPPKREEFKVCQPTKISKMQLGFVFEKQGAVVKKCPKPQRLTELKITPPKPKPVPKQLPTVPSHESPLLEGLVTELKKYEAQPPEARQPTPQQQLQPPESPSPAQPAGALEKLQQSSEKSRV